MRALIALFAASLFTTAVADDKSSKHDASTQSADAQFDTLDRNDDDQLSRTEVQREEGISAEFASIDQNSDGFLSKSEYAAQLSSGEQQSDTGSY